MVIGYDVNFNFNRSNFDVRLKVLKYDFNASNHRIQADTKLLNNSDYKCEIPCIGIPVLKDSSNSSIVVGHHFFNDKENKKIGSYTFSYCPKENHYVNLPDFTFCALIISNHPRSGILSFKRSNTISMIRNFFVKPKPKYISLCSTGEDHCGPVFLKQKVHEIRKKYMEINDDTCDKTNCLCKNKKLKELKDLEKDLKFAYFAPKNKLDIIMI